MTSNTELKDFIIKAQHKIAILASLYIKGRKRRDLELLLELSRFVRTLSDKHYNINETKGLRIAHYLARESDMVDLPLLEFPAFVTNINVLSSGAGSSGGGVADSVAWASVTGKPGYFLSNIVNVEGLSAALGNKADKASTYTKAETDNLVGGVVTSLVWKNKVATPEALYTTYPGAVAGWTASADSTGITYRFDGVVWVPIKGATIPLATDTVDGLMSKQDKAKLATLGVNDVFAANITVSLGAGRTLGRYANGEVIPAAGKTPEQVFNMIAQEPIAPEANISISGTPVLQEYNQLNVSPTVNWNYTIKTLGATVSTVTLERSRDNITWTGITVTTVQTSYTETLNVTANNSPIYYRLTVTDSAGATKTVSTSITFKAYAAPSISFGIGTISRERGDKATTISGTVTRNAPNIALASYQLQYSANGGIWTNIGASVAITGASATITSVIHNDATLVDSNTIAYRVQVVDAQQTTTSAVQTVTFIYSRHLGFNTATVLTIAQVLALPNKEISDSKARTVNSVTATGGNYTYIVYRAGDGDIASIIQDGALPVLGAFTKLTDVTGTNSFGATVTMRVYRSNSTDAFTNRNLTIS